MFLEDDLLVTLEVRQRGSEVLSRFYTIEKDLRRVRGRGLEEREGMRHGEVQTYLYLRLV